MAPVSNLISLLSMLYIGEAACTTGTTCLAEVTMADHSLMQSRRLTSPQVRTKPPSLAKACGTGGVSGFVQVATFKYGSDYLRRACPHPAVSPPWNADNCGSPSHCAAKCAEDAACVGFTVPRPGLGHCPTGWKGRSCRKGRRCYLYNVTGVADGEESDSMDSYRKCDPPSWPNPVPADGIICPVLATGVHQGHLMPDGDGNLPQDQWEPFMNRLGAAALADFILGLEHAHLVKPLKIYEMNDKLELEHGASSGIRDPAKNRSRMDALMSYADPDGVFTRAEFEAAGKWFEAHPHAEMHEIQLDNPFTPESVFSTLLLSVFGRCGEKFRHFGPETPEGPMFGTVTTHYPTRAKNLANSKDPFPCAPEKLYMRQDDLENIMWRNRFPDDFELS